MLSVIKPWERIVILLILITTILGILTGCGGDSNPVGQYKSSGKSALVIVVAGNNGLTTIDEMMFQLYKDEMLSIFSEVYGIPISEMQNMTANEIADTYGENWAIHDITKHAAGKFDTIIALHKETAALANLKQTLLQLSDADYTIDMVLGLHGNSQEFALYNEEDCNIEEFANFLKSNKIRLRVLYQICCFAGKALDKWSTSGVYAVNGVVGNNFAIFSPGFFMDEWVNGTPFKDAVNDAFKKDTAMLSSYNDRIPIKDYLLTPQNISASVSLFAGRDTNITIRQLLYSNVK